MNIQEPEVPGATLQDLVQDMLGIIVDMLDESEIYAVRASNTFFRDLIDSRVYYNDWLTPHDILVNIKRYRRMSSCGEWKGTKRRKYRFDRIFKGISSEHLGLTRFMLNLYENNFDVKTIEKWVNKPKNEAALANYIVAGFDAKLGLPLKITNSYGLIIHTIKNDDEKLMNFIINLGLKIDEDHICHVITYNAIKCATLAIKLNLFPQWKTNVFPWLGDDDREKVLKILCQSVNPWAAHSLQWYNNVFFDAAKPAKYVLDNEKIIYNAVRCKIINDGYDPYIVCVWKFNTIIDDTWLYIDLSKELDIVIEYKTFRDMFNNGAKCIAPIIISVKEKEYKN